jgi:hypothetical protein
MVHDHFQQGRFFSNIVPGDAALQAQHQAVRNISSKVAAVWSANTPAHLMGAHEFLMISPRDKALPDGFRNIESLGRQGGLFVVDGWQNIGCKAKDYARLAQERVNQMTANGLLIDGSRNDRPESHEEVQFGQIVPRTGFAFPRPLRIVEELCGKNNRRWIGGLCSNNLAVAK